MIKCNNPKCGHEDRNGNQYRLCPKCGFIMHPVKERKKKIIAKEENNGD